MKLGGRKKYMIGTVAAIVVLAGVVLAGSTKIDTSTDPTEPAPPAQVSDDGQFSLPSTDDQTVSVADYRGKGVLVEFGGTWCEVCEANLPVLKQAAADFADRYQMLYVDFSESAETVKRYDQEKDLAYPVLIDSDSKVANAFRVRGTPTFVFFDKAGKPVRQKIGFLTREEIEAWVRTL